MPCQVPHGSRSLPLAQFDAHIRTVIDLGVWDKQISFYNYLSFFALAFEMKISVAAFQLLVPLIYYLIDGLPTTGASGAGTGKHGCNFNLMSLLEISCHRNGAI
jgi:hypothetical protein